MFEHNNCIKNKKKSEYLLINKFNMTKNQYKWILIHHNLILTRLTKKKKKKITNVKVILKSEANSYKTVKQHYAKYYWIIYTIYYNKQKDKTKKGNEITNSANSLHEFCFFFHSILHSISFSFKTLIIFFRHPTFFYKRITHT